MAHASAAAATVAAAVVVVIVVVAAAAGTDPTVVGTAAEDDDQDQDDPQTAVTAPIIPHKQEPPRNDGDRLAISVHLMLQVPGCALRWFYFPGWSGWACSTGPRYPKWWRRECAGLPRTGRRRAPRSCN